MVIGGGNVMQCRLMLFIILLQVVNLVSGVTTPVTWDQNSYFRTGTFAYAATNSGTITKTISVTFSDALTTTANILKPTIGIQDFELNSPTQQIRFLLQNPTFTSTSLFTLQLKANNSQNLKKFKFLYFIIDPSCPHWIKSSIYGKFYSTPEQGPFNKTYTETLVNSGGSPMDFTHETGMILFLSGMNILSDDDCFQLQLQFFLSTQTNFQVNIITDCVMKMMYFSFSRINFDKTVIQQTGQTYFDYGIIEGFDSDSSTLTKTFNNYLADSYVIGLHSFSFSGASKFQFSSQIASTSTISTSMTFKYLKFLYFSVKTKVCASGTPYFRRFDNLCYDICDVTDHIDQTNKLCYPCYLHCSIPCETTCAACTTANHREASGTTCPCSQGYFDTSTTLCSTCDTKCRTCSSSSTSCTSCHQINHHRQLFGSSCVCSSGYYDAGTDICSVCAHQCATCTTSSQNCVTCKTSTPKVRDIAPGCGCSGRYYDDGTNSNCQSCHYSCATCSDEVNCDSCSETDFRETSNGGIQCRCMSKYYDDESSSACLPCSITCQTCDDSATTDCITCNTAAFRTFNNSNSKCDCQTGYYSSSSTVELCSLCHPTCQTCSGPLNSQCLSCNSNLKKQESGGSCICVNGYYQASSYICRICHSSCKTCTAFEDCATCVDSHLTTFNSTSKKCQCSSSEYWRQSTSTCQSCNYKCLTCSDTGTNCTSCPSTRVYSPTAHTCSCSQYYYEVTAQALCSACSIQCETCDSTGCLTCSFVKHRQIQDVSCLCMDKFYEANPVKRACQICHYSCSKCTSGSACSQCQSDNLRQLNNTSNYCSCKDKYYEEQGTLDCKQCLFHCATCFNEDSCVTCQSATNHRQLNTTTELCECQPGYYDDETNQLCLDCLYDCLTCTNGTKCATCDSDTDHRIMSSSTERCICQNGYYQDTNVCKICDRTCSTCSSLATTCLTCSTAWFRYKSGSTCPCKNGYYDDAPNSECKPCHYSCQTCINAGSCSTCDSGTLRTIVSANNNLCLCPTQRYYDNGADQICKNCNYTCQTCTDINSCSSCNSQTKKRESDSNSIYCRCSAKYYDDGLKNQQCITCKYSCATCKNSSSCQTCSTANHRHIPTQSCPCIDRYYSIANVQLCSSCQYTCLTCIGQTKCTTCDSSKNRQFDTVTDLCICNNGYYDTNVQQCQICDYTCLTCQTTSIKCLTCNTTAYRSINTNTCPCEQYYFDDLSNQLCQPCHYSCATCSDSSTCDTCQGSTNFRETDPANDKCRCKQGYYDDGSNQLCIQCEASCLQCIDNLACSNCNSTLNRQLNSTQNYLGVTSPFCICLYQYFSPASNQACQACHYSCEVCSDSGSTACLACQPLKNRTFNSSTNQCPCDDGLYDDGANQQCLLCGNLCLTCQTNSLTCTSCDPTNHRIFSQSPKKCSCAVKYYQHASEVMCRSCHYSCATCTSLTSCINCNLGSHRQNPVNGKCGCSQGYYDNGNSELCMVCPLSCLACTNATACSSCNSILDRQLNTTANFLGQTSQFCICIDGYYSPAEDLACLACHHNCEICSGPALTDCRYCDASAHRILNNTANTCFCDDGWYDSGTQETCTQCHQLCRKCTDGTSSTCSLCAPDKFLFLSQTSCFETCPSQYFGQISTFTCQPCDINCKICDNQTHCTQCLANFLLYRNKCLDTCPQKSSYQNTTASICIDCPSNCLTCQSNIKCIDCMQDYYRDQQVPLCFACHEHCKGCSGSAYNHCLDCEDNLLFKNNQCFNISCSFGQYVDTKIGCVNCNQTFSNSLTCNKSSAILCLQNYKILNGQCLSCNQVQGYHFTKLTGDCSQICGDGKLIEYQCDDGNKIDGDGCASNCIIQQGWNCVNQINQMTVCQLTGQVSLVLMKLTKYGGKNRINLLLEASMSIKLNLSEISIFIDNSIHNFTWNGIQNSKQLKEITVEVDYQMNIQGKNMTISYGTIGNRRLLAAALNFEQSFTIQSFPPAEYYSIEQLLSYQYLSDILKVFAIIIMVLCAVSFIFPKKMYMNLFTYACLPAQLYIAYGLMAEQRTDWIKSSLQHLDNPSLIFGFDIYQCCQTISFFGYSTKIPMNAGIIISIILALWLAYGLLTITSIIVKLILQQVCTSELCSLPHLTFSAVNSLYNSSVTYGQNPVNVCVGIVLNIYLLAFITGLWLLTYSLQKLYAKDSYMLPQKQVYDKQIQEKEGRLGLGQFSLDLENQSVESSLNQTNQYFFNKISSRSSLDNSQRNFKTQVELLHSKQMISQQTPVIKQIQNKYEKQWFIYEYVEEYQYSNKYSKYFLPYTATKIYLFSLISSVAQSNLIVLFSLLLANEVIYIIFLLIVRPFTFKYHTAKHCILQICQIIMNSVMIVYVVQASQGQYYSQIEYTILIIMVCLLGIAITFIILDIFVSWRMQLWNCIEPCLISLRLRNPRKIYPYPTREFEKPKKIVRKLPIDSHISSALKAQIQQPVEQKQELNQFFTKMVSRNNRNRQDIRKRKNRLPQQPLKQRQ